MPKISLFRPYKSNFFVFAVIPFSYPNQTVVHQDPAALRSSKTQPHHVQQLAEISVAGVPGAGGFDVVFAVTLGYSENYVTKSWSSFNVLALLVGEDPNYVSLEAANPRTKEITSSISSVHIQ
ncbi:hypothetical protein M0R45_018885 [Rubus argutus]|uniref:Uncharacterized protein n=1 Tax=Rubus argutus TaxID=59490 RepID=A0AAW1X3Y8_RUBAR